MDITEVIDELRRERDMIDAAISALDGASGSTKRGYRRRKFRNAGIALGRRPRRRLSAAARKRISEAAKARWAKAKKAGKTSL